MKSECWISVRTSFIPPEENVIPAMDKYSHMKQKYSNIQNVLWSIKKRKRKRGREASSSWWLTQSAARICFYMFPHFPFFKKYLRVKLAEGSRAPVAHLGLFLYAGYICSLCPTGIQLGFGLHRTIQRRRESEQENEWGRERQREDEELRTRRRKKNNFCFHKPHMSCTHSPRNQWPNVVVM